MMDASGSCLLARALSFLDQTRQEARDGEGENYRTREGKREAHSATEATYAGSSVTVTVSLPGESLGVSLNNLDHTGSTSVTPIVFLGPSHCDMHFRAKFVATFLLCCQVMNL